MIDCLRLDGKMDETNTTLKRNAADLAKLRVKYASGID